MLLFDLSALTGGARHAPLRSCVHSPHPALPKATPAHRHAHIEMRWRHMPSTARPQAHWVRANCLHSLPYLAQHRIALALPPPRFDRMRCNTRTLCALVRLALAALGLPAQGDAALMGRYLQVSPDLQWISNPGYNHARGPARVPGVRVHVAI